MRILVVDESKDIRELIALGLEAASFAVDAASNGKDGATLATANNYDCIILDYNLPKKNGLEICKELRQHGNHSPIIMLTIKNPTVDITALLQAGADDCITKPFSFEELLARIQALLRRPRRMIPEVLTVGDVTLNTGTHQVKLSGKNIYLTKKEFALLEYLMHQQGSIVSRNIILEHVWNMDVNPLSNTVEAHIFNLRRKIEKNKKYKLIENIPGRGYRLTVR